MSAETRTSSKQQTNSRSVKIFQQPPSLNVLTHMLKQNQIVFEIIMVRNSV